MTTTELASYQNGNVAVQLLSDGTKIREYEGTPTPVHPESIDLKITDWCDAGCGFCHESSTVRGRHANVETILRMIKGLPPGVEVAIGGGDPFSHPDIKQILAQFKERGLIANVTINSQHIERHVDLVWELREQKRLYGLGVSYHEDHWFSRISKVWDSNTICHFIAGEHQVNSALGLLLRRHPKMLVLGYKLHGRGTKHFSPRTEHLLKAWKYWIGTIMQYGTVCFDNLALKQLDIKSRIPANLWEQHYMGDDGQFTMYADAVRDEYAISSTSPRVPAGGMTAVQYFLNCTILRHQSAAMKG